MDLLQLPPELLLRVSAHLTTPELGHFRQSCKHVEAALFDSFAREFFTKRQFMIEHVSLQALVGIANHPTLSRWLSDLIIGLHAFRPDPDYMESTSQEQYRAGQVSRDVLLDTGQARDMLVEAFSKLPNLRTVGLRDYDARGRSRDGEDARWRSYGWSYGVNQDSAATFAHFSRPRSLTIASPESTLPLVLYALGRAHAKPENIDVFLRKHCKLMPSSFNVVDGYMATSVVPVLAGLKRLMLTVALGAHDTFGAPWLSYDENSMTDASLKRFLHHTPQLRTLRLNFHPEQFLATRFLEWLGKPASVAAPATSLVNLPISPVSLSHLTGLDLGMLNVAPLTLLNVITKFNLLSVNLWKVTLHCKNSNELYEEPDRWACFFHDLSVALPVNTGLRSVLVGFPSQGQYSDNSDKLVRVYFDYEDDDSGDHSRANGLDEVSYRSAYGSNIRDWLQTLSARTTFGAHRKYLDASNTDVTEDDDEDEDDESGDEDDDI